MATKSQMSRLLKIARIFDEWEGRGYQVCLHRAIRYDGRREHYRAYLDYREDLDAPLRNVGALGVTWMDAVEALDAKAEELHVAPDRPDGG